MTRTLRSTWLDLALAALVTIAEVAMITPWLFLIAGMSGHPSSAVPSPLGLAFVDFVSYWAARYFLRGGWDVAAARGMSLGTWIILMLVWFGVASGDYFSAPWRLVSQLTRADTALIVMLIAGGIAWWRAIALASEPNPFIPEYARRLIWRGVLIAGTAVVLSLLVGGQTESRVSDAAVFAFPLFLIASLLTAGAAQAKAARAAIKSGADPVRVGLGTASGITLVVIVLAVAAAGLAGRHFWAQLASPLHALQRGLEYAIYGILLAFSYVVFTLLTPVFWLLRLTMGKNAPKQPQAQQQSDQLKQFGQNAHSSLPPFVTTTLEIIAIVAIVAIVAFVFWLILRTLRRYWADRAEEGVDEIHESLWSTDLARNQLRAFLSGLGVRDTRQGRQHPFDLDADPVDVRNAYRHLLVLAEQEGHGRKLYESASDYLTRMRAIWSRAGDPLDDLTLRYLSARYAEESSQQDIDSARRDWRQIRQESQARAAVQSPPNGRVFHRR